MAHSVCSVCGEKSSVALLCVHVCTGLYPGSFVCSHRPNFVSVWFAVERRTEQFVCLIKQLLSSAAPSGGAAARPETLISQPTPTDTVPQGSDQQLAVEETESPARKTTKPQQVFAINRHFEGLMHRNRSYVQTT